jgi:manganese transport protein
VPATDGAGSLYLAAGILGATVMPHAIYLHSALTKARTPSHDDSERGRLLRFAQVDVLTALGLAGLVNMAMLAVAARAFHTPALSSLATIGQAHAELGKQAGGIAALAFAGDCLPPAPPPPAWAPTPARSSWPASPTCACR